MTLIQLGFFSELSWDFVALHSVSAAQIIQLLPEGVANGLNLQSHETIMHSLLPLNTASNIGYTTTTALLFIPTTMVDTISLDLHVPVSALYQNPDPIIAQLMNYLNPNIPLIPGANLAGSAASGTGASATATAAAGPGNDGIFNNKDQDTQTPTGTRNTAVIAFSAVSAAAAYGAAMFFIARRYKKKKQGHRRSSSIMSPSEMRQSGSPALTGGGAYMAGGRSSSGGDRNSRGSGRTGNSARTQQISAPMMAENSLGWN